MSISTKADLNQLRKHFVIQHGQSDCGVACLASILRYHGGERSLDELRRLSGTGKTGTTLLGLYQCALELGFDAYGLEAENVENLHDLTNPAILHVVLENKLQHYVIFYGFENKQLVIGDPGRGIEFWSAAKLRGYWPSKSLLKLTPGRSFRKSQSKSNRYSILFAWIKEDINILVSSLFLGILIAVFSLATAIFSQKLIDVILPTGEIIKLIVGLALFSSILIAKTALGYIRSTFLITQSRDFNKRMISSFFKSLLCLPKSFFDSKKTGEMIARMNDTGRIQETVSGLFGNLLIEFLIIITSLSGVFIYSIPIGFIVLGSLPMYILILAKLNRSIINTQKDVMDTYAANESNYVDVIYGISDVKSSGNISFFHKTTTMLYDAFQDQVFRLGKIQIRFSILTEVVGVLLLLTIISYSSIMVLNSHFLLGSMIAILTLSGSVGPSLTRIAIFNIQIQEAKVAFNRMEEFTGLEPEVLDGVPIRDFTTLNIKDLNFNYPGSLHLLRNIDMKVEKGKITSLLGESGSGKSTILQLIQRFYNPTSGNILLNENNIESYDLLSFRHMLGVVSQEVKIFNNNLIFNIALTDSVDDLEGVIPWCHAYGFDSYFEKFPQGYLTMLGEEGANISGGQKQLVGLARALYKKPKLLLLDESTSAMDRKTEKFVINLLKKIRRETAILLVTHRIQTALESDEVYLLEDGKIVDSGKPKDLLNRENFLSENYNELITINGQ